MTMTIDLILAWKGITIPAAITRVHKINAAF